VIHQLRLAVVPAYLLLCLALGGASAAGIWANFALQAIGLALIVYALSVKRGTPMATPGRQIIAIGVIGLILLSLQLVPLPPEMWTALPGREPVAAGYRMLGQPLPWLPVSLTPLDTRAGLLWTIPALAVLLGITKLGGYKPNWLGWVLVTVAVVSVAIGALQVGGATGISTRSRISASAPASSPMPITRRHCLSRPYRSSPLCISPAEAAGDRRSNPRGCWSCSPASWWCCSSDLRSTARSPVSALPSRWSGRAC
jgi:hypothetical protein